jgi:hypothetical protein
MATKVDEMHAILLQAKGVKWAGSRMDLSIRDRLAGPKSIELRRGSRFDASAFVGVPKDWY